MNLKTIKKSSNNECNTVAREDFKDTDINIDKLNDEYKCNNSYNKNSKTLKWYKDKKLKYVSSLKDSENSKENKLNKIGEIKGNNAVISYQNNDKLDKGKDNNEIVNHKNDKI